MFVRKAAAPVPESSSIVENIRLGQKRLAVLNTLITTVKKFTVQVPEPNALKQIEV
jgi:hypothetical protein